LCVCVCACVCVCVCVCVCARVCYIGRSGKVIIDAEMCLQLVIGTFR